MNDSQRPNILFLFSDQHRSDWVGYEGLVPVRTPHLDALAARGTRFTQCRVNSPMCGPSRACLATGLRFERVGVPSNRVTLDAERPTFMKQLRASGYRVINLGKTDLHKPTRQFGPDGWHEVLGRLGFTDGCDHAGKRDAATAKVDAPADEPYSRYLQERGLLRCLQQDQFDRQASIKAGRGIPAHPFPLAREHQLDDFTGRLTLDWFERMPREAPWFMQVNFGSPHAPFDAAEPLASRYRNVQFPDPIAPSPPDPTDHQGARRQYAAMIEGMDEWIGRIIDAVRRRGELDRTIIVYASDHGEMLGDRGLWDKGFPHEPSIHVPLVMSGPNIASGAVCAAPVELIDLAATFCQWAAAPSCETWDSRSLSPTAADPAVPHRDVTVSSFGKWKVITDGRWKLVRIGEDETRLYDLANDIHEQHDLSESQAAMTRHLAARLEAELKLVGDQVR